MKEIRKWIIKRLGGYTKMPTPRIKYIPAPLPNPVRVAARVTLLPKEDGKSEERYIATQIGLALLEAGAIKFEVIHDLNDDVFRSYQGSVMAIKPEPLIAPKGEVDG